MISVIVPIYNVEKFLVQCIDSVLSQTFTNFELILVDDGSSDGCPAICDEYARMDQRIRVIHKANGGAGSARIAGTKQAIGDYIVCVDGDDWIASEYLSTINRYISEYSPDIICFGYYDYYAEPEQIFPASLCDTVEVYNRQQIEEKIFPSLIQDGHARYFSPSLCTKVFSSDVYKSCQMDVDPRIKIGEDSACSISCLYRCQSMILLPDNLYYYRRNESSMTKAHKPFSWDGPLLIYNHLRKSVDTSQFDFQEQLYRKTVHELFSVIVSQFYRDEPYSVIVHDIREHIKETVYCECIQKAKFHGSRKAALMMFALRHRLFGMIWLWSKVKG